MKNAWKRLFRLLMIICFILLIPLIAMQFTTEVNWGWGDFVLAFLLLFITGALIEIFRSTINHKTYRFILIAMLVIGLVLLWTELAVGLFGSPIAGD